MSTDGEKFIFKAEWFDTTAEITKNFYLYFFSIDNSIELFDIKNKKIFLRRTKCEGISLKDLYVGSMVTIFSRPMKIVDAVDDNTKIKVNKTLEKTFAMLKPYVINKMGEILKTITAHNIHIANIKMCLLDDYDVEKLYRNNEQLSRIKEYLTSGPVVTLMLLGENVINRWNELVGPSDHLPETDSSSLRAHFAKSITENGFHGSLNLEAAEEELNYFFPNLKTKKKKKIKNSATLTNCTCCIVKPHAVQAELTGDIVDDIQKGGYRITAIQEFNVDPVNAEEFLEVYKGVFADYAAMVAELQSGPCIAMEITHENKSIDVTVDFRKFCGPFDPEIARKIRPTTLRAKYGKTKIQNAVHCSDLPEDGPLEVEYFFNILDE
ncbi:nucleoside diphosphate kinase 7 isoform X2 [Chelonus insularis]|uniref:nucleoside diphosphate kinase 7 isoform X2 n=1 Tax=Chelonus insularis TaxID=460826 RepID=UPI00158E37DB|nr:nucleoside diphosphate kinase 7 isoform X2 [Chelonus insularis]